MDLNQTSAKLGLGILVLLLLFSIYNIFISDNLFQVFSEQFGSPILAMGLVCVLAVALLRQNLSPSGTLKVVSRSLNIFVVVCLVLTLLLVLMLSGLS